MVFATDKLLCQKWNKIKQTVWGFKSPLGKYLS